MFRGLSGVALFMTPALVGCRPDAGPVTRISLVGDVLVARGVPRALARDSAALQATTRELWAGSRYVIGNLECPLTSQAQPVAKPFVFRGPPRYAGWLRRLGFTHLALANNHTLDQHLPGLRATSRAVGEAGLEPLGYAADSLAGCRPTVLGADGSVAVFAYSALTQRLPGEGCLCGRDFRQLCERVAAYKTLFPHRAVLVYLHWGTEYAARPSPEQRRQARTLIDCGAAAVVGAHPHTVQSAEFYRGRPIIYSLGNFLFDQRGRVGTNLGLQADFAIRNGWVVTTTLRPLKLVGALPQVATGPDQAALRQQLRGPASSLQLVPAAAGPGWQMVPPPAAAADTVAAFFDREQLLPTADGALTRVRLRYLPRARQYQARLVQPERSAVLDLGFPLYQFAQGDVDNDGRPDLLFGPVKTTRFDSTMRRRLFVYKLEGGQLRPRWLGSRVVYRLLYFRAGQPKPPGPTVVYTLEQLPDGRYGVGHYRWQGFGLVLERFSGRSASLEAAYQRFFAAERE